MSKTVICVWPSCPCTARGQCQGTGTRAALEAATPPDLVWEAGKLAEYIEEFTYRTSDIEKAPKILRALIALATAQAAQIAGLEKERDELRGGITEPHDPGAFVGDIYYGHPEHTTLGTHRWTGSEWVKLPSDTEALMALLASARAEAATLRAEVERLRGAIQKRLDDHGDNCPCKACEPLHAALEGRT